MKLPKFWAGIAPRWRWILLASLGLVGWWTVLPTASAWSSLTNPISYSCRSIVHVLTMIARMIGRDGAAVTWGYEHVAQALFGLGATALWVRRVRSAPYSSKQYVTDAIGRSFRWPRAGAATCALNHGPSVA